MNPTTPASPPSRPLARGAALITVAMFVGLVLRFWHPVFGFTAFLQLDPSNDHLKIAAFREYPVYVHRHAGGYDGLYYAQIAYHPTLRSDELGTAIDSLPYRARRILPPAIAWLVAAGNPKWIVHAYSVLNVVAWLALAGLLWRLLGVRDLKGWAAWAGVLLSAGALASVRLALTDLVATALLAGALLAVERDRLRSAVAGLGAAALSRETSVLALIGAVERPWLTRRNVLIVIGAVLPLTLWLLYLRAQLPPADPGLGNFTWPFAGLMAKWRSGIEDLGSTNLRDSLPTLLVTFALTVQAVYIATRPKPGDRWWRIGAAYVVLMICLGGIVWQGVPGAAARVLLPLTLAFNLLVCRHRDHWLWLAFGNLSVFAGVLTLADVPQDPRELASTRQHGVACVAATGEGWYDRETTARHLWAWCRGRGEIGFEAWPKSDSEVLLELELASTSPRTVVVTQAGREVWRGLVQSARRRQSVPVRLSAGRATLEFSSAEPADHELPESGGRTLAFALYDARLVVPEPDAHP